MAPSMDSVTPLMNAASSERRKATPFAMSSSVASRPDGVSDDDGADGLVDRREQTEPLHVDGELRAHRVGHETGADGVHAHAVAESP